RPGGRHGPRRRQRDDRRPGGIVPGDPRRISNRQESRCRDLRGVHSERPPARSREGDVPQRRRDGARRRIPDVGFAPMVYLLAFLIGLVAGLRAMTAPAAVSWAARLGWLNLHGTPLAFLGAAVTPWIFTVAAIGEIVNDKLPKTGSRMA